MRRSLSPVLAVLAGGVLASACYAERQPPPTFRYACEVDGDCLDGQQCIDGICETPCTTETFTEVCVNGELACLNGVCSSGCEVGKDSCPASYECADLGIEVSGGGFFGGGSSEPVGVCMRPCTPTSCADIEVCVEGFCVPTCMVDDDCITGLSCQFGLCLPDAAGSSSDGGTGDTMTSSEGTGATADATGDASSGGADAGSSGGAT